MLVQSGKPVGVMRTHEWAPRVLIANSNLVGDWANWEEFRRLENLGLTMYGQMTAGSWIYIGTQGILQGTYETFAAVAAKRFGGTLAGTITLTAGLGGMGGAQPLAVTMNGGVAICIDVRPVPHRAAASSTATSTCRPTTCRTRCTWPSEAKRRPHARCRSACSATPPSLVPQLLANDAPIDIVTDQTSAHDPLSYLPIGVEFDDWHDYAAAQAGGVHRPRAGVDGPARRGDGRVPGQGRRGLRLRQLDPRRGPARPATRAPSTSPASSPPTSGRCSARARARSAGRRCPATRRTSRAPTRRCSTCSRRTSRSHRWITPGAGAGALPGPAGAHLLAGLRRARQGRRAVQRAGRLRRDQRADRDRPRPPRLRLGRLAVPRDRGDGRRLRRDRRLAAAQRHGQRRQRRDAGCRSTTAAASASAARSTPGRSCVADGTELAAQKIERVLTNDPGMGVIRHVDAGYDRADEVAAERGVRVPMTEG